MLKSTKQHKDYWKDRKINWSQSYLYGIDPVSNKPMWNHPHRDMIVQALKSFNWFSLWEAGCGPGPNLMKIISVFKDKQVGGSDVSEDAIELARKTFVGGLFHVESVEDMLLSDNSVDVMLTDATLLYIGPRKIDKAIHELVRSARSHLVLCELHSNNWWKRLLYRFKTGYNVYNYRKLLSKHGCYDIRAFKIPKEVWPGEPWQKFGHIIIAKIYKKI